jgi:hypothetical protein
VEYLVRINLCTLESKILFLDAADTTRIPALYFIPLESNEVKLYSSVAIISVVLGRTVDESMADAEPEESTLLRK